MKKMFKNPLLTFILGAIIFGGIVGVSAYTILANDIGYTPKDSTWEVDNVKDAIDELYTKAYGNGFCKRITGKSSIIGSKYECDPGDGKYRTFYVLKIDANTIDLIMDRNINDGVVNYQIAMEYFNTGLGKNLGWNNVIVSLPKAQDIANAVGNDNWNVNTANNTNWISLESNNNWLFNFTRECNSSGCDVSLDSSGAYGYWTQDIVNDGSNRAWGIHSNGRLSNRPISEAYDGVRPVITISKSKLAG